MRKPYVRNITLIDDENNISLLLSLAYKNLKTTKFSAIKIKEVNPLAKKEFSIKLEAFDKDHQNIFSKIYFSDEFGGFDIHFFCRNTSYIKIYELTSYMGLELLVGTFVPFKFKENNKSIIISDLDRTLVDTKFSNFSQIIESLLRPISYFPTIEKSLEIFKNYISQDYLPFILSASPHFYDQSIREWLQSKQIYNANIFLKDFRHFISLSGILNPKDISNQIFFKLDALASIILLTGIPENLVMLGDDFEADYKIYSVFSHFLQKEIEEREVLKIISKSPMTWPTQKQQTELLNKLYQIKTLNDRNLQTKIYIRDKENNINLRKPLNLI